MRIRIVVVAMLAVAPAWAETAPPPTCRNDEKLAAEASAEIQKIHAADQADRKGGKLAPGTYGRDIARRKRIGELFGEGCLRTAADFGAAALVFQHGEAPEHFFQTYIWAKRAVELGDERKKSLMALGIDRYLVNTGSKQLFGSQASKPEGARCACLDQVEATFPEKLRQEYLGMSLKDKLAWSDSLNEGMDCPKSNVCVSPALQNTPAGSVPGLW